MDNEKIDNLLNVSLELSDNEREKADELSAGFDSKDNTWEVIVKYNGDIGFLTEYGVTITKLYGGYAVLVIPENNIETVASFSQIEYMEKPRNMYYEVAEGKAVSCFGNIQRASVVDGNRIYSGLTGKGTIVAVIDSGVDYRHPDFINADGTSRILYIWDQSGTGTPPAGYNMGAEYTREQINSAIAGQALIPVTDSSGHGTHVLGIAAGNGRASDGIQTGCAPESEIIVVKLGSMKKNAFPMTTELMQAINYVIEKALAEQKPVSINISFGNSYGSHRGDSLLETYIDEMAGVWKNVIVVGAGNEGSKARHISGNLKNIDSNTGNTNTSDITELLIYNYTQSFGIQIWKNYVDDFRVIIRSPLGNETVVLLEEQRAIRYEIDNTTLVVYYGTSTPYSINQEIYIEMIPNDDFLEGGIWQIEIVAERIVDGRYDMWLPAGRTLDNGSGFLRPNVDSTITIPATAGKAIAVGAYDGQTDSVAYFSGRGYTVSDMIKPDLLAPGVNILSAAPGGGYNYRTGTSMATPFVTGAASCLMEWGITNVNDPYMYGEKIKAELLKSARQLPGFEVYPNRQAGWGTLCVKVYRDN